jgi:hypothetical protein
MKGLGKGGDGIRKQREANPGFLRHPQFDFYRNKPGQNLGYVD